MNSYEFSKNIRTYIEAKDYTTALSFFKANKQTIATNEITDNEYLVADMLTALRGIKAYKAGFEFLKTYNINISNNTALRVINSYGWLLYFYLKQHIERMNEAETAFAETLILSLVQILNAQTDKYSLNLLDHIFKLIAQHQKSEKPPAQRFLIRLCESITPENLSLQCSSVQVEQKGQTKELELASTREAWYSIYTKALYETKVYAHCIELCKEAVLKIENLHYSNKIWFKRREAQCLVAQGRTEMAIALYLEICKQKHDWFLLKELSACYFKTKEYENALKYACKAASEYGPINFKVELIELLGDILIQTNCNEIALKHYLLVKTIREAEKWKVDNQLLDKIKKSNNTQNKALVMASKEKLKNELSQFWNKKSTKKPTLQPNKVEIGIVNKLLQPKEQGIDGFIETLSGKSLYFFAAKSDPIYTKLSVGKKVQFSTTMAPKGEKAIGLKIID